MLEHTSPTGRDLAAVMQALEEHHLVAVDEDPAVRRRFSAALAARVACVDATAVLQLHGRDPLRRPEDPRQGLEAGLGREPRPRRRCIIWSDAHVALAADPMAFTRTIADILARSAEEEHLSEDVLLLQRLVLIGTPRLRLLLRDLAGPCRTWRHHDHAPRGRRLAAAAPRPRVAILPLGGCDDPGC
jgi:hypothetical protein